ncbi:hypothetical protein ACJX0J_025041, partial [Zea mays]
STILETLINSPGQDDWKHRLHALGMREIYTCADRLLYLELFFKERESLKGECDICLFFWSLLILLNTNLLTKLASYWHIKDNQVIAIIFWGLSLTGMYMWIYIGNGIQGWKKILCDFIHVRCIKLKEIHLFGDLIPIHPVMSLGTSSIQHPCYIATDDRLDFSVSMPRSTLSWQMEDH